MLQLKRVHITQGAFHLDADFSVEKGSLTAITGASGAGKSTLLATLAGFIAPTSGRIYMAGEDVTLMPPGRRPLSILFQDNNLFPHLTVTDNLGLGLSQKLRLSPAEMAQVQDALEKIGLADKATSRPAQLSGGEQARVALARTLLRARPILLLDEPFAALDHDLKDRMLDLVGQLAESRQMTVLMVTHNPHDARKLCPMTIHIKDGVAHPPQRTSLV